MRERAPMTQISGVLFCFAFCVLLLCWWLGWMVLHLSLCPSDILPFHPRRPGRLICADCTDGFSRAWLLSSTGRISEKGRVLTSLCYPSPKHSPFHHCCSRFCGGGYLFLFTPGAPSSFVDSLTLPPPR